MLTAEQNDELTDIAAGTPMGELLRRYWYPVAFTRELEEFPVKHAKLLGEDWAVYKTVVAAATASCRRPARTAGPRWRTACVEADGIRCPYHGWLFGLDGECLEQPAERDETNFRTGCGPRPARSQEMGGLVWAYVGPAPAPELPRFDVFVMDGVRDIGWADLPCNFVQIMENAVDPHHVEFLHGRYFEFMGAAAGLRRARVVRARSTSRSASTPSSGASSSAAWSRARPRRTTTGRSATRWCSRTTCGSAARTSSRCRSGCRSTGPRPGSCSTPCTRRRASSSRSSRRSPTTRSRCSTEDGRHRTDYVEGQDIMAWVTQGPITDRTVEHLGRSDVGVTMLRRMFKAEMAKVAAGRGPARHDPRGARRGSTCRARRTSSTPGRSSRSTSSTWPRRRFSPQADALKKLHIKAQENREGRRTVMTRLAVAASTRRSGRDVGRGWFPADAERAPPGRAAVLPGLRGAAGAGRRRHGLATEYWVAQDRVFVCFCGSCGWTRRHRADRARRRPRGEGAD